MNELEERARRLIDDARPGHNPSTADAARVRAALKARVLAEPLLLQPAPAPAAGSGVLGKVVIALGVGGSVGFAAGVYAATALWPAMLSPSTEAAVADGAPTRGAMTMHEAASGAASARGPVLDGVRAAEGTGPAPARLLAPDDAAAERSTAASHAATHHANSQGAAAPPTRARAAASAAAASAAPSVSPLKAELDGLRRAQELLYQGRAAWAIARLDELDRAGVGSVLAEERAATRAIAECRLGGDGQRQASDYARRFPGSAHLERVRSSCTGPVHLGSSTPVSEAAVRKVAPAQTESRGSLHEK